MNRHMKEAEQWTMHTGRLPPLAVGHCVCIQNQTGPHPNKWDRTGVIIEVRQFDQYVVRVDGSGRITLCNRKFLRRYVPVQCHNLEAPSTMTSDKSLSCLSNLPPHPPCGQQPARQLLRHPISQLQNPLAKAQQAQFPLPLPQHTPAPATQNQQSALHPVLSQNHHHQRLLWSPTRPSPTHHPPL